MLKEGRYLVARHGFRQGISRTLGNASRHAWEHNQELQEQPEISGVAHPSTSSSSASPPTLQPAIMPSSSTSPSGENILLGSGHRTLNSALAVDPCAAAPALSKGVEESPGFQQSSGSSDSRKLREAATGDAFAAEWEEPTVGLESSQDISLPSSHLSLVQFKPGLLVARVPRENAVKPSRLNLDSLSEIVPDNTNDPSLSERSELSSAAIFHALPPGIIIKNKDFDGKSSKILKPDTTEDWDMVGTVEKTAEEWDTVDTADTAEEWDTTSMGTEDPPGISVMCSATVHEESRPGSYAVASACSTDTKIPDKPTAWRLNLALDGFFAGAGQEIRRSNINLASNMQSLAPLELPSPGSRWETSNVYSVRTAGALTQYCIFDFFSTSRRPRHCRHCKPGIEVPVPDVSMPLPAMVPGLEGICLPCEVWLPENEVQAHSDPTKMMQMQSSVSTANPDAWQLNSRYSKGKGSSRLRPDGMEHNCKSQSKLAPTAEESLDDLMWA